jgi:L-2-hydroxyglutarate oxidase
MALGGIEAGPNAVLAFRRYGYRFFDVSMRDMWETMAWPGFLRMACRYWPMGLSEIYRSLSKSAFHQALARLVPSIREDQIVRSGSGVRAQAIDRQGRLLDDFYIVKARSMIHVLNAPSPAATASISIGRHIAGLVEKSAC